MEEKSPSEQIDDIIHHANGWHGDRLSQLRSIVRGADPGMIEEVKWKKPSKPEGVSVWSNDGIVCIGEMLKNVVRLTFPKGAMANDPAKLFNARLDSKSVRAIDFSESDVVDETALRNLIIEAIAINKS